MMRRLPYGHRGLPISVRIMPTILDKWFMCASSRACGIRIKELSRFDLYSAPVFTNVRVPYPLRSFAKGGISEAPVGISNSICVSHPSQEARRIGHPDICTWSEKPQVPPWLALFRKGVLNRRQCIHGAVKEQRQEITGPGIFGGLGPKLQSFDFIVHVLVHFHDASGSWTYPPIALRPEHAPRRNINDRRVGGY